MPAKLSTTLRKLEFVNTANRVIPEKFYEYMRSKDLKRERELILTFLDNQYVDGKPEHDAEGRYITSFNQNKRFLSVFFRWLFNSNNNRDKPDDD